MGKIRIAGIDGSKTNFGISLLSLDTDTMALSVEDLILVKTEKTKVKQVRASSDNLRRAREIYLVTREALKGCAAVFVEVPSGGQSYDAVLGFGIVIGLYASLELEPIEVSPAETKKAALGTSTASKSEMIEWAVEKFPEAPWRMRKLHGEMVPKKDNEHLADGVAIAHAGIMLPSFRQTLSILAANSAVSA
jgi:Holliday junction resolvasome RuvABC endonuclease subunit